MPDSETIDFATRRCALAVAHPGHEIRVHGWMQQTRPRLSVLTDGSGGCGQSRMLSTIDLIEKVGAVPGPVFGEMPDRQFYQLVLDGNADPLLAMAERIALDWVEHDVDLVIGDAREGAIMAHDVWRGVIDLAVSMANQIGRRKIESLAFSLHHSPTAMRIGYRPVTQSLKLSDVAFHNKLAAARAYSQLKHEIDAAFQIWGTESFRQEGFCPVVLHDGLDSFLAAAESPKEYEIHGELQVRAGKYSQVVRYRDHVLPLLQRLADECPAVLGEVA